MEAYDRLAACMSNYDDLAIFRRFKVLHCRNLLLMEAELIHKHDALVTAIARDRLSDDPKRKQLSFNFRDLLASPDTYDDGSPSQKQVMKEIRPLLKDYGTSSHSVIDFFWVAVCSEFLILYQRLCELPPVNKSNLSRLWRLCSKGPEYRPFFEGGEYFTWHKGKAYDLTSLSGRTRNRDMLSRLLDKFITTVYHWAVGHRIHEQISVDASWKLEDPVDMTHYPDHYSPAVVDGLTMILAPILPATSIFALYFIKDPLVRMGMIVLLSFLFSATLALVGVPRRLDAFAATAAFGAIMVVFVSNNTDCGC
ncbi:hypothetical protein A1O3_04977 [Capronia epimyces CBS 606.96]|uniref:DUF6594 domain-containing protein n=1 Tax=Capronia epimyces CBS 606.96 TaxID=1182542 RepID=W9Y3S7_9EURO|nr:uncharacterized protein A1O3_04977 [Capronia epimyces CBS 606.96]EXJ84310.1 hypothetical protein A1O3_04977 [Capronia epimyces CBS 606.96]